MRDPKPRNLSQKDLGMEVSLGVGITIPPILKDSGGSVIWKKGNTEQSLAVGIKNVLGIFLTSNPIFNEYFARNEQGLIPEDKREAATNILVSEFGTQERFIDVFGPELLTQANYFGNDYRDVLEKSFAAWGLELDFDEQRTPVTGGNLGRRKQVLSTESPPELLNLQLQTYLKEFEAGRHMTFEEFLAETSGYQDIDRSSHSKLEKEELMEVQETDFPIVLDALQSSFFGGKKLKQIAEDIIEELEILSPELVVQRRSWTHLIIAVTDRQRFFEEMQKRGVNVRSELTEIQETDFSITDRGLTAYFIGTNSKLTLLARTILETLQEENPDMVAVRKSNTQNITVVTELGLNRFIEEMIKQGVKVRDIEMLELQETDLPLTQHGLPPYFIGSDQKLKPIADEVFRALQQERPDLVAIRRSGSTVVSVVTESGISRFINEMIKRGVKIRESEILEIQESDFPITTIGLTSCFIGDSTKLKLIANIVLETLRQESPELIVVRKNASSFFSVVTEKGLSRFIEGMLRQGVKLREDDVVELQETDFPTTGRHLTSLFIGGGKKLSSIAHIVLETLHQENPSFIGRRKVGSKIISVVIESGLNSFIEEMVKKGVKLRGDLLDIQETDFAVTQENLAAYFVGDSKKLKPIAKIVLEILQEENPALVEVRKNASGIFSVVTEHGVQRFIEEMVKQGAEVREKIKERERIKEKGLLAVQETDLPVTHEGLVSFFIGNYKTLKPKVNTALEILQQENPNFVISRINTTRLITVVTKQGRERFIEEMEKMGVKVREK